MSSKTLLIEEASNIINEANADDLIGMIVLKQYSNGDGGMSRVNIDSVHATGLCMMASTKFLSESPLVKRS